MKCCRDDLTVCSAVFSSQAFNELMHYLEIVRSVGGTMITIWHNNFLGTDPAFEGWKETYEQFINVVKREAPAVNHLTTNVNASDVH